MTLYDRYTLEANLGSFFGIPTWYDISPYLSGAIAVTRGRANEQSVPNVGQLSCDLVNDDGRFTPGLATSPYYPYVVDGAPVRLTARIPAGDNMEDNSSHELGIPEWTFGGFGTTPTGAPSQTHIFADGGQWSMLVTWPAGTGFAVAQRTLYGLAVGQQYTASRWVWVPTGSPTVQLQAAAAAGAASAANDGWTRIWVTFTAATTSHVLQLVPTTSAGGTVWTDAGNTAPGAAPGASLTAAQLSARWYGYALEWPGTWQGPAALAATTHLVAVDVLSRLARKQVRPFDVEEGLFDSPVTYLPLDEADGATQAGNLGSWQAAGVLAQAGAAGAYAFAAGTGPPGDGTSSLTFTPASSTSGWYLRAPIFLGVTSQVTVEAFIATTTVSTTLLDLSGSPTGSTSGNGITLSIDAAGKLKLSTDVGSLTVTSPTSVASGTTRHVAGTYAQDGTNHTARLYVDGALAATGALGSTAVGFGSSFLTVGGGTKLPLYTGTINHVGVYVTALPAVRLQAHRDAGVTGFGGETSDRRISRLAAYAGLSSLTAGSRTGVGVWDDTTFGVWDSTMIWAGSDTNLEAGSATVYGQSQGGYDALAGMNEVAATEGGLVLADRTGALQLQARQHRYNRPPAAVLDSSNVDPSLTPAYDDQQVANDVTAVTQDGALFRVVDTVSAGSPPAGRGVYDPGQMNLLTRDPLDAYSAATWRVARYSVPRPAYRQVAFDLATLPDDVAAALLGADVGDRVDLAGLPPQAPAATAMLSIEGYTETVGGGTHTVVCVTTDAALSQVLVWDSGVWDTGRWAW